MLVMVSNNTKHTVFEWAESYGHVGHLFSPDGWRKPRGIPYALDNGRYPCWSSGKEWSLENWAKMLQAAKDSEQQPLWALVPDVVADRKQTLLWWDDYAKVVTNPKRFGFKTAFAVQDGMTERDVPESADVVFVGGTTEWKWANLHRWTDNFPRVHVGRVNGWRGLWTCYHAGVESCDGTGWFRGGDSKQLQGLHRFLQAMAEMLPVYKQHELYPGPVPSKETT